MIELLWNDPISIPRMQHYIDSLDLRADQTALDIGCGTGEILIRIHERFGIQATGIDADADLIAEANRRAEGRIKDGVVCFEVTDGQALDVPAGSLDLCVCMGASHALRPDDTACEFAITTMARFLKPGGKILFGEGYMKQPASPEYRAMLGDSMPDSLTHSHIVELGKQAGLIPLAAWTSSLAEWDDFEWNYQRIIESKAERNDPVGVKKLEARRSWMNAYLAGGRDTLGYGIYIFKKLA